MAQSAGPILPSSQENDRIGKNGARHLCARLQNFSVFRDKAHIFERVEMREDEIWLKESMEFSPAVFE